MNKKKKKPRNINEQLIQENFLCEQAVVGSVVI